MPENDATGPSESVPVPDMWGVEAHGESAGGPPAGGPPSGMPPAGGPPTGGMPGQGRPAGGPPKGSKGEPPAIDATTGAHNVSGFVMNFALALQGGLTEEVALWYLDIRNFRSINPNFGFLIGNMALKALVRNLRIYITGDLPIGRLGADRFIFLSAHMDYEEAVAKFDEMVKAVNAETLDMGIAQPLDFTAGIYYLRPEDIMKRNFSRCMDYVSIAHRNAKKVPKSALVLFTEEDLENDRRRILIEQTIDAALMEGQIEVWYQPQIDYTYGNVVGAEALARWKHPELGWISPLEFIPVLEKCGRVHDLDLFVWEEACRSAGKWHTVSDGNPVPISVNVSRAEMFEEGLMEHFLELRERYGLPAGSLRIEITESAFVEEADRLYGIIDEMRKNQMLVEMDDFGSGLSSLNMLKDVPVDVVKLDMGFMRNAMNEERGGVVLGSVIRMLQGLDTPIIAEGVETLEQAEILKNMGCHLMQGFHFSKPMPIDDFEDFLSANSTEEQSGRTSRTHSKLEDLMSFDATSSFLFNNAVGGMILFLTEGGMSESILVNDQFYEECGLDRRAFGDRKVDPVMEIDEESRATMWRAAAEARENGSARCTAKVGITGRWIDCVMRYVGESARGNVFSMSVLQSGTTDERDSTLTQVTQDSEWDLSLLSAIIPNGFVKCAIDDKLTIDYVSPSIVRSMDMTHDEFMRKHHNSLANMVAADQRASIIDAAFDSAYTGELIDRDILLENGSNSAAKVKLLARAKVDETGRKWLYCLILNMGYIEDLERNGDEILRDRTYPFEYDIDSDRLRVSLPLSDGTTRGMVIEHLTENFEEGTGFITQSSAAKIAATIRDLRNHPMSGFTDIKCNIFRGETMRWYHVNYECEADDEGHATVIHGYAQDANDQMGSAKWWREQAEIDYLTGLLNRNAVEQEINMAIRVEGCGMMFMIDLDGFKRVNDEFGHLSGDALLRDVAECLDSHFRDSDILGRYGGDEFVAFMPAKPEKAHELAEKRASDIIDGISKIEVPDGTFAGCSIGVAVSANRDATFYDLLEVADQAMYESKLRGKGVYTIKDM